MPGRLNDLLPDPLSTENERLVTELLKRKMKAAAAIGVHLLHAMEARFGPEARQVMRALQLPQPPTRLPEAPPEADLQTFCTLLERGCTGSHQWERTIDAPDRLGYHFSQCLWAEIYRELGEPELGAVLCASDAPAAQAYNPQLGLQRTQTLMQGDACCDHIFFVVRETPPETPPLAQEHGHRSC